VICIREGAEVLDTSALIFTKRFYALIFQGEKICDAFKKAKADVESQESIGSANMFILLTEEEWKYEEAFKIGKQERHVCREFGPLRRGEFQNLTEKIEIKYLPAERGVILGRTHEMFELV